VIILYILGTIALLNLIFWWCRKSHELEIEKITKIGRIEARVGIESPRSRDFDLTISWDPLWYFTFQLSLWSVYCGFGWSRDTDSWPDCNHNGVECYNSKCSKKDDNGK